MKRLPPDAERYRAIVENQAEFVDRYLPGGILTYVNRALAEYVGMRPEELVGRSFYPFMHRDDLDDLLRKLDGLTRKQPTVTMENRVVLPDGVERWHQWTHQAFFDRSGKVVEYQSVGRDITERRRTEEALRDSEERFRSIYDNIGIGIALISKDMEVLSLNPQMQRWFPHISAAERHLCYRSFHIPPRDTICEYCPTIHTLRDGQVHTAVTDTPTTDGIRQYQIIATPLKTGDGSLAAVIEMVEDVTDRMSAERRLRESEDRFRSIFDHATDGIMIADIGQKRTIEANGTICSLLGYSRDELLSLHVEDLHPKEDLPRILTLFERQVRGEISLAEDIPLVRKDGSTVYTDVNATSVILGGRPCLLGIFRDITERKKTETALRLSEHRLAESERMSHVGSWEHNPRTNAIWWSDELFRLLGLDPAKDNADFGAFFGRIHPADQPMLKAAIERTLREKRPFNVEYRFSIPGQPVKIIHARADLVPDASGELSLLRGTAQDITERKLSEEKLKESEQFIRNILDTVDEGFIVIDRDYRIVTCNKAYCGQAGLPCDEVIGRHCFAISHKAARPCYEEGEDCAVRHVFKTGEPHAVLHKHRDAEGQVIYVETKAFPIRDAEGNITSAIETISNITEKHLLEEERLKTQKLESIGTLAGGIAHDFNNLLQGVFGYISMAKMTYDQRERSLEMLEQAEKALHQSVNLTSQLLTFSKGGKPVRKVVDLRPVIENAARFALSGSRSGLRLEIAGDLRQVEADAGQVGQVIQNIVLNADQAMPMGGTVAITARNLSGDDPDLPHGLARKDHVAVSIQDNGIGIAEQHLSKIFDPYFTTKEKGSGLGLATSYSIIRNHDGVLMVRSTLEQGTAFTLYLPASDAGAVPVAAQAVAVGGRKGRILVMDDEAVVRAITGELIKAIGHEPAFAEDGDSALERYRESQNSGQPFDAVILDLTIRGGMGGIETLQRLREIDPAVKAVVSSGYSDEGTILDFRTKGFQAFLQKPYDINELQRTLGALLR